MKTKITVLLCLIFSLTNFAQNKEKASVEKSIFGIQIGTLGAWVHNESRLANKFSLRSEIGMELGYISGYENGFFLYPSLRIEPRYYYNLDKRLAKGKSIKNNSGNFLGLLLLYNSDIFVTPEKDNVNYIRTLGILPKWAIKRTIGNHFTYETGIGLGYVKYLEDYFQEDGEVGIDLHLRIGYTF